MGGNGSPLFPLINNEKVRLLADAIVNSKANWYKDKKIIRNELPTILNGVNSALNDNRLQKEVVSGGERQEMLYHLQRFFSRMAYLQIRPQHSPIIPLGQLIAIVEFLPNQHWEEFPKSLRDPIRSFPNKVSDILGVTVADIISEHDTIVDYYSRLGLCILHDLPVPKQGEFFDDWKKAHYLADIVDKFGSQSDFFQLQPNHIEKIYGKHEADLLQIYGKIFSKPIIEHRQLLSQPEYKVGTEGWRLSTLDRFPLIEGKPQNIWYVPNIRCLRRAASDVIHFTLNESNYRKDYEEVRGPLLELYLTKLLKSRAPSLTVIPEEKWMTNKGEVAGPDLVVIDHGPKPFVLGIEVKFRRMIPCTRFELRDEDLVNNYEYLWKDIKKLPDKLGKVFSLPGGYQNFQKELSLARNYKRFYLGIVGEAPYLFGELSLYLSKNDISFPLYNFPEPWAVMSTETFEYFIEVVVQHQRSIAEIMNEFVEDCADIEFSCPMAELFRSVKIDETKSFAASFLPKKREFGFFL